MSIIERAWRPSLNSVGNKPRQGKPWRGFFVISDEMLRNGSLKAACGMFICAVLGACGGGGGDGSPNTALCDSFVDQSWQAGATTSPADCGSFANGQAAVDGNLGTAASASVPAGCTETVRISGERSNATMLYPAGSKAGAFITRSANIDAAMLTVSATLNGNAVQVGTGPTLEFESTAGNASADEYVFITAAQSFNGVEITANITDSTAASLQVFELCSNGTVR